ncbi:uncharacterized protein EI97DRAFT_468084 [Westerdykella ornata]|uniref:DUF1772-domain-containing protein n=1 Tax=Westerdykella ornata TaxID=318751 RepID=A0A6A6JFX6_WESOR|nr:uncharacterized protein EI97DRAFT_468084 [Westerdykella ornata]KAF2275530.1 hypothetical protein EI97DRAFT_468084 [Westerdykella ornata]
MAPSPSIPTLICVLPIATYTFHALSLSKQNIDRLLTYEREAERAAQWSQTAAQRLRKSRMTQAAGVFSLAFSIFTCFILPILPPTATMYRLCLAAVNSIVLAVAALYKSWFWNERTQVKIPLVGKFNAAVAGSEEEVRMLGWLCGGWAAVGCALWWLG